MLADSRCLPNVLLFVGVFFVSGSALGQDLQKTQSTLYGPDIVAAVRRNVERFEWAGAARDALLELTHRNECTSVETALRGG